MPVAVTVGLNIAGGDGTSVGVSVAVGPGDEPVPRITTAAVVPNDGRITLARPSLRL